MGAHFSRGWQRRLVKVFTLRRQGLSCCAIAKQLGTSHTAIAGWLRDAGLDVGELRYCDLCGSQHSKGAFFEDEKFPGVTSLVRFHFCSAECHAKWRKG